MNAPVAIALVICDSLYQDIPGGKPALIGLFSNITAQKFPAAHPRICVYVSVTEVMPNTQFRLDIVHSETDDPVATLKGPAPPNATPLQVFEMHFDLRNLVFPSAGTYYVRFWGNDNLILQRPLELIEGKQKQKEVQ